jgi:hypothetical protein
LEYYLVGDPEDRLFTGITASRINTVLKSLENTLKLPRATTYSFRRSFFNFVFSKIPEGAAMMPYTLHHSETVTKAFYLKWSSSQQTQKISKETRKRTRD